MNTDFEIYKKLRNKVDAAVRRDKRRHTEKLIENIKDNKKAFYGYVRSKQSVKVKVKQIKKKDGSMTSSDEQAAQELNDFFQSVFIKEDSKDIGLPEFTARTKNGITLSEIEISPEGIRKKLEDLKSDKAPGPDGLHPAMLKKLAGVLCTPL